jgi:hypothetical protein
MVGCHDGLTDPDRVVVHPASAPDFDDVDVAGHGVTLEAAVAASADPSEIGGSCAFGPPRTFIFVVKARVDSADEYAEVCLWTVAKHSRNSAQV